VSVDPRLDGGHNMVVLAGAFTEGLPEHRDVVRRNAFLDEAVGPDPIHQGFLRNDLAPSGGYSRMCAAPGLHTVKSPRRRSLQGRPYFKDLP